MRAAASPTPANATAHRRAATGMTRRARGDRPRGDRPQDRSATTVPRDDRGGEKRPYTARRRGEARPASRFQDRKFGDKKPYTPREGGGEKRPYTPRGEGFRKDGDRPRGDRPYQRAAAARWRPSPR